MFVGDCAALSPGVTKKSTTGAQYESDEVCGRSALLASQRDSQIFIILSFYS